MLADVCSSIAVVIGLVHSSPTLRTILWVMSAANFKAAVPTGAPATQRPLQVAQDAHTCSTTSTRQSSPALLSKRDTLCVPSNTWAGTDDACH